MAPVVIGKLSTTSKAIRDEYVQHLIALSDYALKSEPEVSQYAIFVPRDEADDKTCWVLEEYATKAAFDTHMASPPVQDMIKWIGSGNILATEPLIRQLDYVDGMFFSKPEISKVNEPYVVFATIEWHPGKRDASIPYWNRVFQETKSESGTFSYGVMAAKDRPDTLHTFEVYESKEYLWDVHVKENSGVQATIRDTKDWRISLEHNLLQKVGGFLHR
ncbi:uncharacterized protein PV09_06384 [Verruconis gallopava]|uniref:ABM domain-containing protein n=1 Tax=Verruconis gallopava TaxID=253628 RepID=A0A0D1XIS2_9PEZI|nr:uncharacterized protein PV09_06384 [Verruconis gallopava]KIW02231.1 hypothetical protein PV09_06384 [Verruconis gallopava]